jgi:hypothetical protein
VFVTPSSTKNKPAILEVVDRHCRGWVTGYEAIDLGDRIHIQVPASERTGHESHFASVLSEFVRYFHHRSSLPGWERPNLLAKYHVTTMAAR